jgi:hypothetical protein
MRNSPERKAAVLKRMLPPNSLPVRRLSQEEGISESTLHMRHGEKDRNILANRTILYANARAQKPERWSGKTCNWQLAGPVWLNPERETGTPEIRDAA